MPIKIYMIQQVLFDPYPSGDTYLIIHCGGQKLTVHNAKSTKTRKQMQNTSYKTQWAVEHWAVVMQLSGNTPVSSPNVISAYYKSSEKCACLLIFYLNDFKIVLKEKSGRDYKCACRKTSILIHLRVYVTQYVPNVCWQLKIKHIPIHWCLYIGTCRLKYGLFQALIVFVTDDDVLRRNFMWL